MNDWTPEAETRLRTDCPDDLCGGIGPGPMCARCQDIAAALRRIEELKAEVERLRASDFEWAKAVGDATGRWQQAEARLADARAGVDHYRNLYAEARKTITSLEAWLARVVERHRAIPNGAGDEVCIVCGVYWPCGERRHYDSLAIAAAQDMGPSGGLSCGCRTAHINPDCTRHNRVRPEFHVRDASPEPEQ